MTKLERLIAPAAFMQILLPIAAVNLVLQFVHLVGWIANYDGEKTAYIISAAYIVAIGLEALAIIQGRER